MRQWLEPIRAGSPQGSILRRALRLAQPDEKPNQFPPPCGGAQSGPLEIAGVQIPNPPPHRDSRLAQSPQICEKDSTYRGCESPCEFIRNPQETHCYA